MHTQIQLPDPLYKEVQRVAREQDWSIAEVIRRGVESVIQSYPQIKEKVSPIAIAALRVLMLTTTRTSEDAFPSGRTLTLMQDAGLSPKSKQGARVRWASVIPMRCRYAPKP